MHPRLLTERLMAVILLSAVGAIASADYNMPLVERQFPPAGSSSSTLVGTSVPPIFSTTSSSFSSFTPIVTLTGTSSSFPTASLSLTSSVPSSSSIPPTSTIISSTSVVTTSSSLITTSSIAPSTSISYVYSSATPSQTAQPQNSGGSLSPNTTKIIIIVVCTVGGVLAIAAIGFVWRKFSRRRKDYGWDEDDFFGSPPPPPQHMSYQQPMGQQYNYQQHEDPFKRTLDQYHRSS
ncbi:hypothetical protein INT43_000859 [Umbelopsis isabellina]|uniref:Mid2 domain-containing protein n=1 Tax=Mortierella isabellina TaxID=91625 RepID=A0A8H7Q346_MORIS|nr:hypothetical protein INT43_000859 [Umbelopsis isabellina]